MMKKVLMLALSSLMVLGLAACGNTNGADASSSASKRRMRRPRPRPRAMARRWSSIIRLAVIPRM